VYTVVETEAGAWAVVDGTGRQVWASPSLLTACQRAAADLVAAGAWLPRVPASVRRSNRARAAAWARIDGRA
jgi:hypothetical protein